MYYSKFTPASRVAVASRSVRFRWWRNQGSTSTRPSSGKGVYTTLRDQEYLSVQGGKAKFGWINLVLLICVYFMSVMHTDGGPIYCTQLSHHKRNVQWQRIHIHKLNHTWGSRVGIICLPYLTCLPLDKKNNIQHNNPENRKWSTSFNVRPDFALYSSA